MNILVLNCGSSSLKFQLIATDLERIAANSDRRLAHGQIERIGGAAIITFTAEGVAPQRSAAPVKDIRSAVEMVVRWIASDASGIEEIKTLADIHVVMKANLLRPHHRTLCRYTLRAHKGFLRYHFQR